MHLLVYKYERLEMISYNCCTVKRRGEGWIYLEKIASMGSKSKRSRFGPLKKEYEN
jgi:hypothetical protein